MFRDREDACQKLVEELRVYCGDDCIIIGIPRGGAVVASCISNKINKPWDIIVTRKIGAPANKEVAIGAVAKDGHMLLNEDIINYFNISKEYIEREASEQVEEIKRRLLMYRGSFEFPDVEGKTVIIVDDGIATGFTILAAINSIREQKAGKIIVAVPVASIEAINILKKHVDEIICIEIPNPFVSVSYSYINFEQNTDEEVISLFKQDNHKRLV